MIPRCQRAFLRREHERPHSGCKFLVIGAAWMVNSETDNLVIAHYLGPAQVTPYSITFGLFATATLLQILAYPSLWPAYSEAYARKDFAWIERGFARISKSVFFSRSSSSHS